MRHWALVAFVVTASAACVPPRPLVAPLADPNATATITAGELGKNDVLEIRVYQEADLSGVYRVSSEGSIDFPLCGRVKVVGLTGARVSEALEKCLKAGFLRRPQVSVLVKEFNSKKVFVFGEVSKPGAYPFEDGMTIIHAVSQAGGMLRTASKNSVTVTRVVEGKELKQPVHVDDIVNGRERNFPVLPGDIIFVPEAIL